MRLVIGGKDSRIDEAIARWVLGRLDPDSQPKLVAGMYYALGVVNADNKIVAGIVYSNYSKMGSGGSIEIAVAADDPRWCQKGILRAWMHYPFIQQNCHIMIAMMKLRNKRVRKLASGLGFQVVGKVKHWP